MTAPPRSSVGALHTNIDGRGLHVGRSAEKKGITRGVPSMFFFCVFFCGFASVGVPMVNETFRNSARFSFYVTVGVPMSNEIFQNCF